MAKTYRKKRNGKKRTIRNNFESIKNFEKQVTVIFLEMLMMVKLFHWKTHSHSTHKATDELYTNLNEHIDTFIEVLLGKAGNRIELTNVKSISLIDLNSQEQLKQRIKGYINYLVSFTNNKVLGSAENTDLLNIRDEILSDLNQFLYLLTFK
jgi:DNA-binding ferritin-like protein